MRLCNKAIIWINGAFGIGKTTVAQKLQKRLPNSLIFDPEEVGFMLRSILKPIDWSGNFQDYPMWRILVPEVARLLEQDYHRTLIVPMSICRSDYFSEVIDNMKKFDQDFHHFCLVASVETIQQRLTARGQSGTEDWAMSQIDECVRSLHSELFVDKLDAETKSTDQLVEQILKKIKVS